MDCMSAYVLPEWMQWTQALGVIGIAGIGAWIAYRQSAIARARLNFDLFDKRYKVFEGVRDTILLVVQNAALKDKELASYNWAVVDAPFLFNEDIQRYVDDLRKKFARIGYLDGQIDFLPTNNPTRPRHIEEKYKLLGEIINELEEVKKRFRPYLNLRYL